MNVVAEIGRNASFSGCSSMVEQQLPKLPASAENLTIPSKTRHVTGVTIQALSFRAQNKLAPDHRQVTEGLTTRMEVR